MQPFDYSPNGLCAELRFLAWLDSGLVSTKSPSCIDSSGSGMDGGRIVIVSGWKSSKEEVWPPGAGQKVGVALDCTG